MTKNKARLIKIKCNSLFQDQILIPIIHSERINFMTMPLKGLMNLNLNSLIEKLSLR